MAKRMFTAYLGGEKAIVGGEAWPGHIEDSFLAQEDILIHGVYCRANIDGWVTELATAGKEGAVVNVEVTQAGDAHKAGALVNVKCQCVISLQGAISVGPVVTGTIKMQYIPFDPPIEVKEEGHINLHISGGSEAVGPVITVAGMCTLYYSKKSG